MGWFLKNSGRKGTGGKAAAGRSSQSGGPDASRTLLALKLLGVAALAVTLTLGWMKAENLLRRYATQARAAQVSPESVRLLETPTWMGHDLRERLRMKVAHQIGADPLDSRSLVGAARQLRADPWVEAVHQVRRAPEGVIHVEADYRAPAAMIATEEGYHIVDADRVWLEGPVDRAASRWAALPLITGVSAAVPDEAGDLWRGRDIDAALALHELLRHEPYENQITSYDVSHRDLKGRLWLVLYTDGPAVVWGLPPGREQAIEPPALEKLDALRDWAYVHDGRINTGANVVWVYTGIPQTDARPSAAAVPNP